MNDQTSTMQQPAPTLPPLPKMGEIAMEFWGDLLRGVLPNDTNDGKTTKVGGRGGGWR